MIASVDLQFRDYGDPGRRRPAVVLLHGLFGSSVNWHSIARELASDYRVLVPDLRNHGRSPHVAGMSYPEMTADIMTLLRRLGLKRAALVGHSMGAKVAMWLALRDGATVERLVAVDMAPVTYPDRFENVVAALEAVDLERIRSRSEAEQSLAEYLDESRVRQYLLQSLALKNGRWAWRMNLTELRAALPSLVGYPKAARGEQYPGPALFIYGADSAYVTAKEHHAIRELFPYARLHAVAGAAHWVYADQPQLFLSALRGFLSEGQAQARP